MTTDLTGIQVAAFHGLLQNEGMQPPDIDALHQEYQNFNSVGLYYEIINNISNVEHYTTIGTYTGFLSEWSAIDEYVLGDKVVYSGSAYEAIADPTLGENPQSVVGQNEWIELTDPLYKTYTVTYEIILPLWIRESMLDIEGGAAIFLDNFNQVLSNTVISSSNIVNVKLNNRKVIHTLAEDFPAMVGSIPQQFISNWGDGLLIPNAYNRTATMFPVGAGCRLFSSVLNQSQAYSQLTKSIYTSAAQSTFSSDSSPVSGGMGGVNKLAGNSIDNLQDVGACMFQSGSLINLQAPWISYSAANVLKKLQDSNALYVGNVDTKVMNKTFMDPLTQRPQLIYATFIEELINNSNQNSLLNQSILDQALADFINQVLDSEDVQQIAEFLEVTTEKPINNFSQLLDPTLIWNSVSSIIEANTDTRNIVDAITKVITQYMRIGDSATAVELGSSMTQLQPINGEQLSELTQPTSPQQFQILLDHLGIGSGENGSMRCEDCVGQTNYNEVLAFINTFLSYYYTDQGADPLLLPATNALKALQEASVNGLLSEVVQPEWIEYISWAQFVIDIKDAVDPVAREIRDQVDQLELGPMLTPYNRLAETHNTSFFVFAHAPIYQTVPTGIHPIYSFVKQLANFGVNEDQFDAQQIIEDCCDDSVTGQAIKASVREAFNLTALSGADIGSDANSIDSAAIPVPETGVGLVGGGAWPPATFPYSN